MRVLGFSQRWPKLQQDVFTTFRYPRLDRDWYIGEHVQLVYKPRSKDREVLGEAVIWKKEVRELDRKYHAMRPDVSLLTDEEAQADGFESLDDMFHWMEKTYGRLDFMPRMNKLTLSRTPHRMWQSR